MLTHFPKRRRFSSSDRCGLHSWCAALNVSRRLTRTVVGLVMALSAQIHNPLLTLPCHPIHARGPGRGQPFLVTWQERVLPGGRPPTVLGRLVACRVPSGPCGLGAWWLPWVRPGGGSPGSGPGLGVGPGACLGGPCRILWCG